MRVNQTQTWWQLPLSIPWISLWHYFVTNDEFPSGIITDANCYSYREESWKYCNNMAQHLFKFQLWLMASVEWLRLEGASWGQLLFRPAHEGPPRAGCPWPCPGGFKSISKDEESITLDNLCHCSVTLSVKKALPDVRREPPVLQFVSTVSGLVTGHHWKEPGSSCLLSPFRSLCTLIDPSEPSLLQAEHVFWSGS